MGAKQRERFDVNTHFGFGDNWADYARHLDQTRIAQAVADLTRLLPPDQIKGKTFLDIGCGSGLHSLAALKMGASSVTAVDFDPNSVATTRAVLEKYTDAPESFSVQQVNILAPGESSTPLQKKSYDVVYSWGVLHHTGDQWTAIANAASMVKSGGTFIIAIYKKTPLCGFWRIEKKIYTALPVWLRPVIDYPFALLLLLRRAVGGENPVTYVRNYHQARGMRFMNDIKDWLGGYPYESASAEEIKIFVENLGFTQEESFNTTPSKFGAVFGSTCAEYRFKANT